ncbi:hypothetical protein DB347_22760 [Opitutaceae bacterium EW11]|nr:hypothetical protein DB347_22760 [Opitutaceae bacterium EW11]
MNTSRERLQVVLALCGVVLFALGIFQLRLFHSSPLDQPHFLKGAYAEAMGTGALSVYSPWMIGLGVLFVLAAWAIRDR